MTSAVQIGELIKRHRYDEALQRVLEALRNDRGHIGLQNQLFLLDPRWRTPVNAGRFRMRSPSPEDFEYYKACFANADFMREFHPLAPRRRSDEDIRNALRPAAFPVAQRRSIHWVVEAGNPTRYIAKALASLVDIQIGHRRAEFIVGAPDPADRGTGLIIATTLMVLDFAFNRMMMQKITAVTLAENPLSLRPALSVGFEQEGYRTRHLRDPYTGNWRDIHDLAITEEKFRSNRRLGKVSLRLLGRDVTLASGQAR